MPINLLDQLDELEKLSKNISDLIFKNEFAEIYELDQKRQKIIKSINVYNSKLFKNRLISISRRNIKDSKILEKKFYEFKRNNNKTLKIFSAYSKN